MIEVRRSDGIWFRVTYPWTVETNGGKAEQKMAALYAEDYQLDIKLGDRHWTDGHERQLAEIIYDEERATVFDDSKQIEFDTGETRGNGIPKIKY